MKLIRCMFVPEDLPQLLQDMARVITGMTVWEMKYSSSTVDRTLSYRGVKYKAAATRVVVEILTDDSWLEDLITALVSFAPHGRFDDEFVHVFDVEASYRIRTGFMEV